MAMLIFDAVGSDAVPLAEKASDATGVPVGIDPDLGSATFDSDEHDEDGLQRAITEALAAIDPNWQDHLQVAG